MAFKGKAINGPIAGSRIVYHEMEYTTVYRMQDGTLWNILYKFHVGEGVGNDYNGHWDCNIDIVRKG